MPMCCGHQADGRLAAAHVLGHGRGDLLPALGHALRDHAVVRAEHDDRALCDRRPLGALDGRELRDRLLQQPQAAQRDGNIRKPAARRRPAVFTRRLHRRNSLL